MGADGRTEGRGSERNINPPDYVVDTTPRGMGGRPVRSGTLP